MGNGIAADPARPPHSDVAGAYSAQWRSAGRRCRSFLECLRRDRAGAEDEWGLPQGGRRDPRETGLLSPAVEDYDGSRPARERRPGEDGSIPRATTLHWLERATAWPEQATTSRRLRPGRACHRERLQI